ncbi:hypothetical protein G7Y89_g12987 [Cudoniella acicularis]|uniref:GPI-anchored wall transfer protein n=1 Tax=Cudoniella acicularis TaxID=354080 RepID=A0A8H4VWH5_9HELO|nr:hypothetical protein G7Y89_g12987 [Cudoniella acicularis]
MSRAAEAAMKASYKSLKEDFVSGLTGGEIAEINYVTAVAPAALALWSALQSRQSFFKPYTPLAFAVDFLLNVGAILLAITLYSRQPILLNLLILAPVAIVYALPKHAPSKKTTSSSKTDESRTSKSLTKEAILNHIPGGNVSCYMCSDSGSRLSNLPSKIRKGGELGNVIDGRRVRVFIDHVKGLDYAEHVTEYGVHWNFFFTLGFLPPFLALFQSAFQFIPSYTGLAILLGTAYQVALEFTNLKAFILTAPRTDLFSKNREGIFSFFGYLAIFLAGQSTGMFVIPRALTKSQSGVTQRKRLLLTLGGWSIVWILLYFFTTDYSYGLRLNVSRRLANLPYILWTCAFNCSQITAFCLVETIFFPQVYKNTDPKAEKEIYDFSTSRVLEAFNRNGLAVFLVANLLTGLVNLTIPTLHMSDVEAMGILLAYASVLTTLAVGLDVYDISIKM